MTIDMVSKSSSCEDEAARTAAALSSTDGTDCSSCSVNLPRGMRWGSVGIGEGAMGSMSRSNIAEEEEWLPRGQRMNERTMNERCLHGCGR